MSRIRYKLWFWLICLADRISPDHAFRATGLRYRFVLNKGIVVDKVDFEGPGALLWAQDSERHKCYNNGEFFLD